MGNSRQQNEVNGGSPSTIAIGSPVNVVPVFMRDGHYVIFGIPENPDGTGMLLRGVALIYQATATHWFGHTLTKTGQIIGCINGPWRGDEILIGYPATLADVWNLVNT